MKTIKARYDYLLVYLAILIIGCTLVFFFIQALIISFRVIGFIFLGVALSITLSPLGKQRLSGTPLPTKQWLYQLGILQLSSGLVYWAFQTALPTTTLPSLTFSSGLYPWPLYLLFAIALAYFGMPLQTSLRPILGKMTTGILGIGADLMMKQSLFFITAFTLGLFIVQICQFIIPFSFGIYFQTLLLGSLLLFFVASPAWRRYTHYLWLERYTTKTFLVTTTLLVTSFMLVFHSIAHIIAPYLPPLSTLSFQLTPNTLLHGQLLSFIWWLSWIPLIAQLLQPLIKGRQVREVIGVGMVIPITFALLIHFPTLHLPYSPLSSVLLTTVSLGLVIFSFHDKAIACLLISTSSHSQRQQRISLSAIRSLLLLVASILMIYLLTQLMLITPLIFSLAAPCFFAVSAACSGYLLCNKKKEVINRG